MRAIAYTRCSTNEQADSGLGLKAQEQRIRAYCGMKGANLIEIVTDAGVSGGKPLAARDGGRQLLEAIRKHRADAVIMLKLDRMFRPPALLLVPAVSIFVGCGQMILAGRDNQRVAAAGDLLRFADQSEIVVE